MTYEAVWWPHVFVSEKIEQSQMFAVPLQELVALQCRN